MRATKKYSSFFLCLLINLLLNGEWSIPAWFMLFMHYYFQWNIWLFYIALGLWIAVVFIEMAIIRWMGKCSSATALYPDNKNPYSATVNSKKNTYKKQ